MAQCSYVQAEHTAEEEIVDPFIISEIVDDIYLGCLEAAQSVHLLERLGVKLVLSVCFERILTTRDDIDYRRLAIKDTKSDDLISHFDLCYQLIKNAVREGNSVLVHCRRGVSRSATIVIAYLMRDKGWDLNSTLTFVEKRRIYVKPNTGFMKQLKLYERIGCRTTKPNGDLQSQYRSFFANTTKLQTQTPELVAQAGGGQTSQETKDLDTETAAPIPVSDNAVYKCRVCRDTAFPQKSVISAQHLCVECPIHVDPEEWMWSEGVLSGKILCRKCKVKLGSYDWTGKKCECGIFVTPWFHFPSAKLDICEI